MNAGRRRTRLVGVLAAAVLVGGAAWAAVSATTSAGADGTIPAGYDLFETDPAQTLLRFQTPCTVIPAGFFNPGSDPFQGFVKFTGVPLETFSTKGVGDADMIVHRTQAANPNPDTTVPIELVRLSLVSMEPITVTYHGGQMPELWNVTVQPSPTQPSKGFMTIHAPPLTGGGGTFDSQFQVIPKLVFTRLSDRRTRTFDAGILAPTCRQQLIFQEKSVPWRAGCVLPALAVTGLNDGFCPGLTTTGVKRRGVLQATLASHAVYPAQPALEHFKCYTLDPVPFTARDVFLQDQFLSGSANVSKRAELCNPARKNAEPFVNRNAHLQCYETTGDDVAKEVVVRNQLGSQRLVVHRPQRLCLPSEKRLIDGLFRPFEKKSIDHFRCYGVVAKTPLRTANPVSTVTLEDQFGKSTATLGGALRLCAPVAKKAGAFTTPVRHPVKHLVCYRIAADSVRKGVEVRNQFERVKLTTRVPTLLCVPSDKVVVPK